MPLPYERAEDTILRSLSGCARLKVTWIPDNLEENKLLRGADQSAERMGSIDPLPAYQRGLSDCWSGLDLIRLIPAKGKQSRSSQSSV